ncbi:transcriptional regulator [Agreia sp. Leaf335]|uniref:LacI family DNA-binding transcriptional regulator n=1 Tax=Agreia sp. Leaf335 TaxID=1736340 RepID=UPI0006F5AAD4|nr:transcriptional regulator [Agreia sp. Leaf335]
MDVSDQPGKTGIRLVASLAGVSHMTVSRVLNGHTNIRPATRQRVLDVISELNFTPSTAARALATHRSRQIGVVVESAVEYGPMSTIRAIEEAARDMGYSLTTATSHRGKLTPTQSVEHLLAQGVDALCMIAPRTSSLVALRQMAIAVPVLVIKSTADRTFLTAGVDQVLGTNLLVDHLAELGHRDILHISGPLDWSDAQSRLRAFHARIRALGLPKRPHVVGDWTADTGYEFARALTGMPDYTAIFAANDDMALGIMHGLHDRGIAVPHDVSVVGFDDLPTSRHLRPPLTTVEQDFTALGVKALELLHSALESEVSARHLKIPSRLVVRESTAPPRSAAL